MGRIDQAMSRANLDAGLGTGAEMPAPAPSPWQVDQREDKVSTRPTRHRCPNPSRHRALAL